MDNAKEIFREEAYELLEELSSTLLELEQQPDDLDLVGKAFRALHTIKGSGAMFGFDELAGFVHDIETVFDRIRDGGLQVTKKIIDLTLASCDVIKSMVSPDGEGFNAELQKQISEQFALMAEEKADTGDEESSPEEGTENAESEKPLTTHRIRFRPEKDLFLSGTNPLLLLNELRDLGDCSITGQTDEIPPFAEMDPENCYTYWDIIITTDRGMAAIKDVFIFIEDGCNLEIDTIKPETEDGAESKKLGEILVERGDVTPQTLDHALGAQKKIGEVLVETGTVGVGIVASALAEQEHVKRVQGERKQFEVSSSIRVAAGKVDTLVDLVGEMVTVQARLTQTAAREKNPELTMIAEEVERLTAELRDNTMSIRMLPIGTTFSKFKRVVRDLSAELGKDVALITEGAETELDKTVIERLGDPLMHLIRNCIDHGIEPPEAREAAGKPRQGTIYLSASHSGAHVVIQIDDDGAGMNTEAIRGRAIERDLIKPDAVLSDKEIFELVFAPGFSTAQKVTSVSGRGVGMDVVRQNIDALRGTIDISSDKSKGTTVTLKLPLTLAIIDGLLVQVASSYYVLPLSIVEECIELSREDIEEMHGKQVAKVRGELVPYVCLREHFSLDGSRPSLEQIAICELDDQRVGFVVDSVIGGHQTVIKNLGKMYRNIDGLSGATILGDGTVALILDPGKLAQQVEQQVAVA